jgi:hypothetical protein
LKLPVSTPCLAFHSPINSCAVQFVIMAVHKTSPFFDTRFIKDLMDPEGCSGYNRFMNTAVYVRVSTEGQRTDSQELELKRYCRQRGWKDLTFYADKISGAKASRPQLDRMMQDIRAGKIERLIVYKLDRLGRSLTHLALILDELNRLQVPLIASSGLTHIRI